MKFDAKDQEKVWRSFKRDGVGLGTLFDIAKGYGWRPSSTPNGASAAAQEQEQATTPSFDTERIRLVHETAMPDAGRGRLCRRGERKPTTQPRLAHRL